MPQTLTCVTKHFKKIDSLKQIRHVLIWFRLPIFFQLLDKNEISFFYPDKIFQKKLKFHIKLDFSLGKLG